MKTDLEALVLRHTRRVPVPDGPAGDGAGMARRLDAALMEAGFKLSGELLAALSRLDERTVVSLAVRTLATVRGMVGDHVRHNSYFISFPDRVPDTFEFWMDCVRATFSDAADLEKAEAALSYGALDLLTLATYGDYQHTYEQMLAVHDELIASARDRVAVLHLGRDVDAEARALYLALGGSATPLNEDDARDLAVLAAHCVHGPQPEAIPVREIRAVINRARVEAGGEPLLDTVTDVLRLACALGDGDVTLQEPTRFPAFPRRLRRVLLGALDAVIAGSPAKLADVGVHRERWKRLGERLHPHEYPRFPRAADAFAVARGDKSAPTADARIEALLAAGDVHGALDLLATMPGRLFRALDRLLRLPLLPAEQEAVLAAAERTAKDVSARVLLSVRDHLDNRADGVGEREKRGKRGGKGTYRVFVNRRGRAWTTPETREAIPAPVRERLAVLLDAEVARRLPVPGRILVDPDMLDVALPLSGRAAAAGLGVLPRGTRSRVEGEVLRFFVYWKEHRSRTDYDLSALMLGDGFTDPAWISYTNLRDGAGEHSGDITSAPDGASEFINMRLGRFTRTYLAPQVNIYSGEGFDQVEESFFGFMTRDLAQAGRPFEPRTVRMKSDLRGPGRVALPMVFQRREDGAWTALWLHLYLQGNPLYNQVEGNRVTVTALLRAFADRRYLTVAHLVDLMAGRGAEVVRWDGASEAGGDGASEAGGDGASEAEASGGDGRQVLYLGLERPDGLPDGTVVITPENLRDLIPS
ncbi:TerD family protein [Actinomadura gamaensis]|uniref:TerD family protein n=1 Tax=Actinomadura gamaensis TaxID=1763541 RepID=A0ABV9TZG6_9ACTN